MTETGTGDGNRRDPRDFMTRRAVTVSVSRRIVDTYRVVDESRDALVLGELAVMRSGPAVGPGGDPYVVVHLPSGQSFGTLGCAFEDELAAALCMEELAGVTNTWAGADLVRLDKPIRSIAKKYGGVAIGGLAKPVDPTRNANPVDEL